MATFPGQVTFGRGILSPRLHARYDIEHWRASLADAMNMVVMRQGGARRREGSRYIGKTKKQSLSDISRLIPFVLSSTAAYQIELSDTKARFWALSGQVLLSGSPYEITTPWAEADIHEIQFVQSGDVLYLVHLDYPPQKISRIAETNWTCEDVELEDGPYGEINITATRLKPASTGDIVPTMSDYTTPSGEASANSEASSTYAAWKAFDKNSETAWISALSGAEQWLQYEFASAVVVGGYSLKGPSRVATGALNGLVASGNWAPRRWKFEGSNDGTTWVVLDTQVGQTGWSDGERRYYAITNTASYSYYRWSFTDRNDSSNASWWVGVGEASLLGVDADRTTITMTATSTTGINSGAGFSSADIGRHVRLFSEDAYWHWGKISAINSTTSVEFDLYGLPFPNINEIATWRLGAFSEETGYPGAVSFYGDRLSYARTNAQPRTKWTSRAVDLDDFSASIPAQDDDAFNLTVAEGGAINWLMEADDILVGTDVSIRSIGKADGNAGFSATNFRLGRKIHSGCAYIQPTEASGATLAVERNGRAIREVTYSFEIQGYKADDISILSEHLFQSPLKRLAFCKTPDAIVWGMLEDGSLISVTYEREQQMVALMRHTIGGPDAFVESISAIPGTDGYELWMIVRRTKGVGILRSVEKIVAARDDADREDCCHLDCRSTYDGAAATTITGLDDFDGMTLSVYANGMPDNDATVTSGSFILASENAADYAHFGFEFDSYIQLLPLGAQQQDGTGLGRRRNFNKVYLSLFRTAGCTVNAKDQEAEPIEFRQSADSVSAPVTLFTGTIDCRPAASWLARGEGLRVNSYRSEPLIVRAVIPSMEGEP